MPSAHTLNGLTINRSGGVFQGLFGGSTGTVSNVGLTQVSVTANDMVGGLVGLNNGSIADSYVTGSVTGVFPDVGGLVGWNTNKG